MIDRRRGEKMIKKSVDIGKEREEGKESLKKIIGKGVKMKIEIGKRIIDRRGIGKMIVDIISKLIKIIESGKMMM